MADAAYLNQTPETALVEAPVSRVSDFIALLKPRVMSLVVFSGAVGLFVAPGALHPLLAIVAILCIAVGSGAAGDGPACQQPLKTTTHGEHCSTGGSQLRETS